MVEEIEGVNSASQTRGSILLNEFHPTKALCDLSHRKLIFMPVPEPPTANIFAVVTNTVAFETTMFVSNLGF